MKAVITFDMPRNCARCHLAEDHPIPFSQEVLFECKIKKRMADGVKAYGKRAIGKRPEWCPLRKAPEMLIAAHAEEEEYCEGWNRCIDEIEGGSDGEKIY